MLLEKIENTVREYNYLLTSQLEEQRKYYEEKVISNHFNHSLIID